MRDLRLDLFRGIALIGITWNHTVPSKALLSEWGHFQFKTNFFFSFAAIFIFISGIVCAIAFGNKISRLGWRLGIASIGDRIVQIVIYNTVACIACILIASIFGMFEVFTAHHSLSSGVLDSFLGSILQYKAMPYFNILNMYVVFLAILPLFLFFYKKWKATFLLSVAVYVFSQFYYYTTENPVNPIFFGSIFSWQFLFFMGVVIGVERENISKLLSQNSLLMPVTFAYLFLGSYLLEMQYAYHYFTSKQYLGVFRILDILAASYLVVIFLENKTISNLHALSPVISLGKNSLPVFSLSLILCYLFSGLSELLVDSRAEYFIVLFVELILLYLIGWILYRFPRFENIVSLKYIRITVFLDGNKRNNALHRTSR